MKRYHIRGYYIEFGRSKKTAKKKAKKSKPRKRLVTWLGKSVEQLSFTVIGVLMAALISGCAFYFRQVPDTNIGKLPFPTALYFSVVSFTSLGYGDIYALHWGKAVVSAEVLLGLMLVAVFIGKIASERQNALLLLVYTSEQERRIRKFYKGVKGNNEKLAAAVHSKNLEQITAIAKECYGYFSSINGYLKVQSEQGDVAAFGNISSLRKLYNEFYKFQLQAFDALKLFGLPENTARTLGNLIAILSGKAGQMQPFHKKDKPAQNKLKMIRSNGERLSKWNEDLANGTVVIYAETVMSPELVEKISQYMDGATYHKDTYKTIAAEMHISGKLAQKCLETLAERGEIIFNN